MKKVSIDFENCYGIRKLKAEFDFSKGCKTFVIYAPNGIMKSSFAKTFQDLSVGQNTIDRIYKGRTTKRVINDESGVELDPKSIFVIEPYNQSFKSAKISTLMVNKVLKEKYDNIYANINDKKDLLLKELQKLSGLKKGADEAVAESIAADKREFFLALERVQKEVLSGKEDDDLNTVVYQLIFNDKVLAILESADFRKNLTEYMAVYDQITNNSNFFKKGVFNHNNASDIAKNLKSNGFFKADHSVNIHIAGERKEIKNEAELEEAITKEKETILNNPTLVKQFESIDNKLIKNQDLRDFRDFLESNMFILPELENLSKLKQKLWIAYLAKNKPLFTNLMEAFESGKKDIEEIVKQAKQEETKWRMVIDIFNERFFVPFKVRLENQEDVILKSDAPSIKFDFEDNNQGDRVVVEENDLLNVLSNGEKRALYILNIIFEVRARVEDNQETIFIVDDIADSFDYKNKYAIIEYLKEMVAVPNFYQIILSHNFDFYRTVSGRLGIKRECKFHTIKTDTQVELEQEKYQKNPFDTWKKELHTNDEMLIAAIPFVRNLAEYCGREAEYSQLTSLLHIKIPLTNQITIGGLENTFNQIITYPTPLALQAPQRLVKDVIYALAGNIAQDASQTMELEKKIVLSIAIRLKTEEFLISKINDPAFIAGITSNQTWELIKKYSSLFPLEVATIKLVEQVNLMTPENIHLNSFMYEPILDMANDHLKGLYGRVAALTP